MEKPIKVGEKVPDFTLKDQEGNAVSLASFRGKKVLLSFHPLAWTPVCAEQMKNLDARYDEFEALSVVPLGLSVDTVPSKKAWAEALGIKKLLLLSDFWPHGAVAESMGLFRSLNGFSQRANVLADEEGKALWVKVYDIRTLPDLDEVFEVLKK